jgi:integrase
VRKSKGWRVKVSRNGHNWRCRWWGKYGTAQQVFAYKADATILKEQKIRDFQRMDAGLPAAPKLDTAVSVADWWVKYRKTKEREHPRTFKNFDLPAIMPFVEQYGRVAMAAVTTEIAQDYKYQLEDKYTGDTARMYYQQVCAFFNAAVRAKVLTESPAKGIKKPSGGGGGGRPLLDSEIVALMSGSPEALFRTGTFSLNTMLRINEVVIFDWAWYSEFEVLDKNGKAVLVRIGTIPANLRKGRAKIKEDCVFAINDAARAVMGERRDKGRVFPWAQNTIQHQLINQRRAVKLPEDITFHCFRHTGASNYLSDDGPDGGHMEDLIKSKIWVDHRSLLRYVRVSPATLFRRFSAMKYPRFSENGAYLGAKKENPPVSLPRGS